MPEKERTKLLHRLRHLRPKFFAHQPRYSRSSLLNKREEVSINSRQKFKRSGSLESTDDDFSGTLTKSMSSLDADIKEFTRIEMSKTGSFKKTLTSKIEQMLSEIEFEQKSVEVMNAQKILDLNKDILRKRLEDPFSIFYKHLLELHRAHTRILEEIQIEKKYQHQRNNDEKDDAGSKSSKRVVLLQPNPSMTSSTCCLLGSSTNSLKHQKGTSHFPIKDIQTRLKNVMGGCLKKRYLISMDGVLHKVPYESQIFKCGNSNSWNCTKFFKRGNNKNVRPKKHKFYIPLQNVSLKVNARDEALSPLYEESSMASSRHSLILEKEATIQMSEEKEANCSGSSAETVSFFFSDSSIEKAKDFDDEVFTTAGSHRVNGCEYPHSNTFPEHDSDEYISTSNRYNEPRYNYVKSVLEVSGVNKKHLENIQPSGPLLNQIVFEEVEILYDQLLEDSKLLFDCIDEVLEELKYKCIVSSPWMSIIKSNVRPFPVGDDFVNEVCNGVEKRFDIVMPCTIDMMIERDFGFVPWVGDWVEIEGAVVGIGDEILEYVMEETILELWN